MKKRKNIEIVLDALFKRIPVKLGNQIYVIIEGNTCIMTARKDTKTGNKYISYLQCPITVEYLLKESEELTESDIMNIIHALAQAQNYLERYNELPEMFNSPEYEQELLDAL